MKWQLILAVAIGVLVFSRLSNAQEISTSFHVNSIAYSPDGTQIAVGGGDPLCSDDPARASDYGIQVFDALTNDSLFTLEGYHCSVTSIAWNPDGTQLASTSDDGSLIIWDMIAQKQLANYGRGEGASENQIVWSSDGKFIASSFGSSITIRDAYTGQLTKFLDDNDYASVIHIAWKSDSNIIAVSTIAEHIYTDQSVTYNIELWDVSSSGLDGLLLKKFDVNAIYSLNWNHDGSKLCGGGTDNKIRIIDPESGEILVALAGHVIGFGEIAWSPDSSRIASGGADNKLRVWDVQTGEELAAFDYDGMFLATVAWSPDGSHIAYSGSNPNPDQIITIVDAPIITDMVFEGK